MNVVVEEALIILFMVTIVVFAASIVLSHFYHTYAVSLPEPLRLIMYIDYFLDNKDVNSSIIIDEKLAPGIVLDNMSIECDKNVIFIQAVYSINKMYNPDTMKTLLLDMISSLKLNKLKLTDLKVNINRGNGKIDIKVILVAKEYKILATGYLSKMRNIKYIITVNWLKNNPIIDAQINIMAIRGE